MFEFISGYLNKKAMKQAIKELDLEIEESKNITSVQPVREYKTNSEAESYKKTKISNALSKPQTDAVDLKNFKNWRNTDKVESQVKAPIKKNTIIDDDGEQPEIDNPVSVSKKGIFEKLYDKANNKIDTEKDSSISSFFKEKYNFSEEKPERIVNENKEKTNVKVSLKEILERKKKESLDNKDLKEKEPISEPKENKIKIEVIDFNKDKPKVSEEPKKVVKKDEQVKIVPVKKVDAQKKSKTTNRKPRGKNKRRFDADVISSVDWK